MGVDERKRTRVGGLDTREREMERGDEKMA